jgi:hypothetical protein
MIGVLMMNVVEMSVDDCNTVVEPVVSSWFCDGMCILTSPDDCLDCNAHSRCELFKSKTVK